MYVNLRDSRRTKSRRTKYFCPAEFCPAGRSSNNNINIHSNGGVVMGISKEAKEVAELFDGVSPNHQKAIQALLITFRRSERKQFENNPITKEAVS